MDSIYLLVKYYIKAKRSNSDRSKTGGCKSGALISWIQRGAPRGPIREMWIQRQRDNDLGGGWSHGVGYAADLEKESLMVSCCDVLE